MSATTTEPKKKTKTPQILTEIERQKSVLAELPDKYEFHLFDGRRMVSMGISAQNRLVLRESMWL